MPKTKKVKKTVKAKAIVKEVPLIDLLRSRLEKDFGPCVSHQKVKGACFFSCIACRVAFAMEIIDEAYFIRD